MLKKIISIMLISSMCLGVSSCGKSNNNENETNKKDISVEEDVNKNKAENENLEDAKKVEDLNLVMNPDLIKIIRDKISNEHIKWSMVGQKYKKEDQDKKDVYIIFSVDQINNINAEEIAKKAIEAIENDPKQTKEFWKSHNAIITFNDINREKILAKYILKEGTKDLVSVDSNK